MARGLKRFTGPVRLLLQVLEDSRARRALVVAPPEPGLPSLPEAGLEEAHLFYLDYAVYRRDLEELGPEAGKRLSFSHRLEPSRSHDLAAVFLPKGKALQAYLFRAVAAVLDRGTPFLVVGAKREGIRSALSLVERYLGPVEESRPGRHSVALSGRRGEDPPPLEEEVRYRAATFAGDLEVVSLPGVFSHGRLDDGTARLLRFLEPAPTYERALDFGCGSGVLGAALTRWGPGAEVDLLDSSAMALEAARRTLAANGLHPGGVRASDVLSGARGRYDLIVGNPPFHSGHGVDRSVVSRFAAESGRHLAPDGRVLLVTNRLDYFRDLRSRYRRVGVAWEDRRYRILDLGGARPSEGR